MEETILLGIDCGGTHTDAALLTVNEKTGKATLLAWAKTATDHEDLPGSIARAAKRILKDEAPRPDRVTLGTTLEINAIVQNRADKVGLALTAGPGLDPVHFTLGEYNCVVPGGLDHRGVEVRKLYTSEYKKEVKSWKDAQVAAIACVGKFSPRNPGHENEMAAIASEETGLPVFLGHNMSGSLNFPRRIATTYYSAAVSRIHNHFLDSVEKALAECGINAQLRLLKADGGAIPFAVSIQEPAQSILSGPAASAMGSLALWPEAQEGCSLLLDMGGTTTDISLFLNGSPVLDRNGMAIFGRRTLVRSLAAISIAIGGDSAISAQKDKNDEIQIIAGPQRQGPAMAFGGSMPTLLDALNFFDRDNNPSDRGNLAASVQGIAQAAEKAGLMPEKFAQQAVDYALNAITKAVYNLVENINSRPIYTLAALKAVSEARPQKACLVGGPAHAINERLQKALGLKIDIAPHADVANAIGAALTIPTASLEIYADTGKRQLSAPAINYMEAIPPSYTLENAEKRARELLTSHLLAQGIENAHVEVTESDLFATLDDHGRGAKDMRVTCQARPGILAYF